MQISRRNNRNSRHFFTEAEVNERGMGSRFPGKEVARLEDATSFDELQIETS